MGIMVTMDMIFPLIVLIIPIIIISLIPKKKITDTNIINLSITSPSGTFVINHFEIDSTNNIKAIELTEVTVDES